MIPLAFDFMILQCFISVLCRSNSSPGKGIIGSLQWNIKWSIFCLLTTAESREKIWRQL